MAELPLRRAAEKLREVGVRITAQRQAILEYLYQSNSHPTAEEIFKAISKQDSNFGSLSPATIYNNLKVLKKYNLVKEIYSQNGIARYDGNMDLHHHLLCNCCGKITDFYDTIFLPVTKLSHETGFGVVEPYVELRGVCGGCLISQSNGG